MASAPLLGSTGPGNTAVRFSLVGAGRKAAAREEKLGHWPRRGSAEPRGEGRGPPCAELEADRARFLLEAPGEGGRGRLVGQLVSGYDGTEF